MEKQYDELHNHELVKEFRKVAQEFKSLSGEEQREAHRNLERMHRQILSRMVTPEKVFDENWGKESE